MSEVVKRQGWFRRAAVIGAWGVAAIGGSVFIVGWGLGVELLQRPFPLGSHMKATSALGLTLLALALLLRAPGDATAERRRVSTLTCSLVIFIAGITIVELLVRADLGFEKLLVSAPGSGEEVGRMPSSTATALILIAIGIITIDARPRVAVPPTIAALLIGFIASSGYLLGIESLYGVGNFTGMAAHTAFALVALSLALLSARPERDPVLRLCWPDSGGTLARVMIPLFVVLFMTVTWVFHLGRTLWDGSVPPEALLLDNVLLTSLLVGLIWYLAGVLHDTEQKRLATREAAMRDKDRFMASVGHELRTPVSALVGFADLLNEMGGDLTPEEQRGILEMMARQGADLVALLEDLLVAARSDVGTLSVARVRVDLRAQLAQVVEGMGGEPLPEVEIRGEGVHVVGDPLRVRQIARNLVSNAGRYGGEKVQIEIEGDGERGRMRIIDDGQGIRPDVAPRLFEPYVTGHGEPGRPGSVGLGLSVARNLAILMGGDLSYTRRDGWTVFEVELPLHRPEAESDRSSQPMPEPARI